MSLVKAAVIGMSIQVACAVALGCQCGLIPEPASGMQKARAVFEGTAVRVTDPMWFGRSAWLSIRNLFADKDGPFSKEKYLQDYGIRALFQADRSWKGNVVGEITLLTGRGGGDCGFQFVAGKKYLVFAGRYPGGAFETDMCTPTRPIAPGEAIAILGKPEANR